MRNPPLLLEKLAKLSIKGELALPQANTTAKVNKPFIPHNLAQDTNPLPDTAQGAEDPIVLFNIMLDEATKAVYDIVLEKGQQHVLDALGVPDESTIIKE